MALILPQKVNVERSTAKWDAVTGTLIVTMPVCGRDLLSYEPGQPDCQSPFTFDFTEEVVMNCRTL